MAHETAYIVGQAPLPRRAVSKRHSVSAVLCAPDFDIALVRRCVQLARLHDGRATLVALRGSDYLRLWRTFVRFAIPSGLGVLQL